MDLFVPSIVNVPFCTSYSGPFFVFGGGGGGCLESIHYWHYFSDPVQSSRAKWILTQITTDQSLYFEVQCLHPFGNWNLN